MTRRTLPWCAAAALAAALLAPPVAAQLPQLEGAPAATAPPPAAPTPPRAARHRGTGEQQAQQWFMLLDSNHDGRISREEADPVLRRSPALADYFHQADENGDGYVTEAEIRAVAARHRAERQARRQRAAASPPPAPER
jgi:hypothetical protein